MTDFEKIDQCRALLNPVEVELTEKGKEVFSASGSVIDPQLIVIHKEEEKILYNRIVEEFNWREKAEKLGNIEYPFFILEMDCFAGGVRFGIWEYFESLESLSLLVRIDEEKRREWSL